MAPSLEVIPETLGTITTIPNNPLPILIPIFHPINWLQTAILNQGYPHWKPERGPIRGLLGPSYPSPKIRGCGKFGGIYSPARNYLKLGPY